MSVHPRLMSPGQGMGAAGGPDTHAMNPIPGLDVGDAFRNARS